MNRLAKNDSKTLTNDARNYVDLNNLCKKINSAQNIKLVLKWKKLSAYLWMTANFISFEAFYSNSFSKNGLKKKHKKKKNIGNNLV